ncbi:hypothetical protein ACJMK2_000534 [Sinanodonta woodiana]|uniref:Uncharacterized protein n=1 Tax=Sinanodonta woodiana TaxID=1069815 RepID=A0ABD3XPM8_SINWO
METIKDEKEIEDVNCHFVRDERQYLIEEMNPTLLKRWLFKRLKIDEGTEIHLDGLIAWNDMFREEKMKILIYSFEQFDDGYELLRSYCLENDKFVYGKVFQKAKQKSRTDHKTEVGHDKGEGIQMLLTTSIDFSEDPTAAACD